MASGCVCVCYDSGGISELMDDEENGYLIPKGDIEKARLFSIERYTQHLDEIWQSL